MKKFIFVLLFMNAVGLSAQISEGGYPPSFLVAALKGTGELPSLALQKLDVNGLLDEDSRSSPLPERYAIYEEVDIDLKAVGLHEIMADQKGEIWRFRLNSPDARSVQLFFDQYILPAGSRLYIYDESHGQIFGAFTEANMNDDSSFIVADFPSDHVIIEYFEPFDKVFEGKLIIGSVGKAYKNFLAGSEDENGYIGINCTEAEEYQEEKHAVCRITFRVGNAGYLCTGTLMNNVRNDGTPYFLTANHCISDTTTAKTLVAYFNYEDESCSGQVPKYQLALSGATMLSTGTRSDYSLLLLGDIPPPEYMPYYAGWDLSEPAGNSGVTIHHAEGGVKRIALDLAPPVSYDQVLYWNTTSSSPVNSHWMVQLDLGRTSTGSSGAPLFTGDGKVIGQLHGGDDVMDFYGKLDYSWTTGAPGYPVMKSFLDPDNTDTLSVNGFYLQSNLPEAQFFAEFDNVCQNTGVTLMNRSVFGTYAWEWAIAPGTVTYLEGTDYQSREPVVAFNEPGPYSIRLTAESNSGTDVITRTEYITAGTELTPTYQPVNYADSCLCEFDSLSILAQGAEEYLWSLTDATGYNFFLNDTLGRLVVIRGFEEELNDTVSVVSIYATGNHGNCSDTTYLAFPLISQPNDNIDNALQLDLGLNGPFTNQCATVQDFEPVPPHFSCTSQLSWCDEVGVDIVGNSLWFYFTGPASGEVSLKSTGFDNEIAIYDADSFEDILNGKYALIAANDDRSFADYNAIIYSVPVTEGDTYWVQVDGSGGNSEGTFYLDLDDKAVISATEETGESEIIIYPQPAGDQITVLLPDAATASHISLEVHSVSGRLILSDEWNDPSMNDRIMLNTADWINGVYFIRIILDVDDVYYGRIIK